MPSIKGIGTLNEKIIIQQAVTTTNDHNEAEATSWETVCTPWARVEDEDTVASREFVAQDQITAKRPIKITIRWREGLNERMRVKRKNKYYGIVSINEPDRKRTTTIKAILNDDL
jgi:SPP1 family predicted phage head-tail adaptor